MFLWFFIGFPSLSLLFLSFFSSLFHLDSYEVWKNMNMDWLLLRQPWVSLCGQLYMYFISLCQHQKILIWPQHCYDIISCHSNFYPEPELRLFHYDWRPHSWLDTYSFSLTTSPAMDRMEKVVILLILLQSEYLCCVLNYV